MAKIIIDVKEKTKETIKRMAIRDKKTQKAVILDALGIVE